MSNAPPPAPSLLLTLVCLLAFWAVAPALAADIYKYVDDEDVPHYTDQWQMIPEKYRSRVQALDPSTGKIFKPESGKPAPPSPLSSSRPPTVHNDRAVSTVSVDPPFYAAWLEKFSEFAIPLPSRLQLGVGVMSVVVIWGAFKISRVSPNPLVKLMLKSVMTLVLLGGAYALYLASLSDRISNATKASPPQNISGKDLLQDLRATTEKAGAAIKEKALAPLEKAQDATVGEAIRTRDSINQSYREQEKAFKKIESGP